MPDAGASLHATLARTTAHRTDGELLAAFVHDRDADAFAALVRRLGPRVLAVCRRVTGHTHDADDAFQAVFLVLARRAAVVNPPEAVAGWVYGVAVRTAQDARAMAARRRSRISPAAAVPDTPVLTQPPPDLDQVAILDEEVARLPDHLRAAVVLCELDGLNRKDAAARLGIAEGTLSSRLATARKRLAAALARRGVVLGVVLAASASTTRGSVPLIASAARWGPLVASGEGVPAGAIPTLADRASRIMLLNKLKPLLVVSVVGLFALAVIWGPVTALLAADPPKAEVARAAPKPVNKLLVWRHDGAVMLDPDGKNETKLFELEKFQGISHPTLSPDGSRVAYLTHTLDPAKGAQPGEWQVYTVAVREVGGKEVTEFKVSGQMLVWSPDGKELLVTDFADSSTPMFPKATATVLEVATKKETTLTLPADHLPMAFVPDGKRLLTMHGELKEGEKPVIAACLVTRDGKEVTRISDPDYLFEFPCLSPDGKALLFLGLKAPDKLPEKPIDGDQSRLYVQPVGGKVAEVADVPKNAQIQGFCWSPDGKKIAYTWREVHKEKAEEGKVDDRETESHLVVCDADGKNAKTILSEKGKGQWHITLSSVCWR
jgi:RNA polymerase sigma factor (sigma-70 family)